MTHIQLKQAYWLRGEIRLYEGKLRELRQMYLAASRMDGMPRGSGRGDKVADLAVRIADLEDKITYLRLQLIDAEAEIMNYISGIDDSYIRQIVYCRHIGLMSWTLTAHKVGGRNTAETCRKAYARFMKKEAERGQMSSLRS